SYLTKLGINVNASSLCQGVPVLMKRPPRFFMFCNSWYTYLVRSLCALDMRSLIFMMSSVTTMSACLPVKDAPEPTPMSCAVPLEVAFKLVSISNADCFSNSTGVPYNPMDNDWNISDCNNFAVCTMISFTSSSALRKNIMFSFGYMMTIKAIAMDKHVVLYVPLLACKVISSVENKKDLIHSL